MSNARMRVENAAQLAAILEGRRPKDGRTAAAQGMTVWPADAVLAIQKAARILHRNAERACNEDCGCPACRGDGDIYTVNGQRADYGEWRKATEDARGREACRVCAGTGQTFGKREANMMRRLRAMLAPYRLRVYEQGDPRGWPLYLIPDESGPASEDASRYNQRGTAVCPH